MLWDWLCCITDSKTNDISTLWVLCLVFTRSSTDFWEQVAWLELLEVRVSLNTGLTTTVAGASTGYGGHCYLWSVSFHHSVEWESLHFGLWDSWNWCSLKIRVASKHHTEIGLWLIQGGHLGSSGHFKAGAGSHRHSSFTSEGMVFWTTDISAHGSSCSWNHTWSLKLSLSRLPIVPNWRLNWIWCF